MDDSSLPCPCGCGCLTAAHPEGALLAMGEDGPAAASRVVSDHRAILATTENASFRWNAEQDEGTPAIVTYTFLEGGDLPDTSDVAYDPDSVSAFTSAQRDNFERAAALYSDAAGLVFVEVDRPEDAMIDLHNVSGTVWAGFANYPHVSNRGDVDMGGTLVMDAPGDYRPGTWQFSVLVHELGHAVGLQHPHEGRFTLAPDMDNDRVTVMSYNDTTPSVRTLGSLDEDALTVLYGAPVDTRGWTFDSGAGSLSISGEFRDDVILATGLEGEIAGGAGNDLLLGRGDSFLRGGAGTDTLRGGAGGENTLRGNAGDDLLYAGEGGYDALFGDAGNDTLTGMGGETRMYGGAGDDSLISGGYSGMLFGDDGDDVLNGSAYEDTLQGGAGHDNLQGGSGADMLVGGDGNDTIDGGRAPSYRPDEYDLIGDTLHGEAGDDLLIGRGNNDLLDGGADNDDLRGGHGDDSVYGGDGADTVYGEDGADLLRGNAGDDLLRGDTGDDTIRGEDGRDTLIGDAGADDLNGGADDDLLSGGDGQDMLRGGDGADTLRGGGETDLLLGDAGDDLILGDAGTDDLRGGAGADHLKGGADDDRLAGQSGDDTLRGGTGADRLDGSSGNDALLGEDGRDTLSGGQGDDLLAGGAGLDMFLFNGGHDTLTDWTDGEALHLDVAALGLADIRLGQVARTATSDARGALTFHVSDEDSLTLLAPPARVSDLGDDVVLF
ncbi:hypothetical protein N9W17_05710 [Jannaschia sp.]|nr:hypothetical protein [Jannaschia sp.]